MKLSDSNIINIECNSINVKEIKKTAYRGLEIYAVKRSTAYSNTECAWLDGTNTAWWCGYVEVPLAMYSSLKPRGYLDEEILYRLADPYSYNLEVVHGGYTYLNYGIPCVLADNQRIFLGWDYNHSEDTESCVTYDEIINEGKKVIDSMFKNIEGNNNEYTYDNLIVDPYKEGIESLIGKEVYCNENPYFCLKNANKKSTDFLGVLMEIHKYNNNPFCVKLNDGVYKYPCIIEKKEEPKKYIPFESVEEFLDEYFLNKEKYTTGILLKLEGIWLREKETGALCMSTEIWDEGLVIGNTKLKISGTDVFNDMTDWDELLKNYTFIDGTQCGKLMEDKND